MGLFDKLKNIFIEEEEIESEESYKSIPKKIEVKEETKKEEVVKEIPQITKEDVVSDRDLIETNQKFKFPIIFEEDDFKEERKKSKSINVLERENTKYEPEIKREVKPQKKTFKPSPVISPVYGVLDKNYTKDEISSKDGLLTDSEDKVDIDYVIMNPPYATIEPFVMKALGIANKGVLMLGRLQFLEGQSRYENILKDYPPTDIYVYVDRISCDKNGTEKMGAVQAYAWFYWDLDNQIHNMTKIHWIRRSDKKK